MGKFFLIIFLNLFFIKNILAENICAEKCAGNLCDFSEQNLTEIPDCFLVENFPDVEILDFTKNNFSTFPDFSSANLQKIIEVNFAENNFSEYFWVLSNWGNLQKISFAGNQIESFFFHSENNANEKLRELNLSSNNLFHFSGTNSFFKNLEKLNLAENPNLFSLPPGITKLKNLNEIILSPPEGMINKIFVNQKIFDFFVEKNFSTENLSIAENQILNFEKKSGTLFLPFFKKHVLAGDDRSCEIEITPENSSNLALEIFDSENNFIISILISSTKKYFASFSSEKNQIFNFYVNKIKDDSSGSSFEIKADQSKNSFENKIYGTISAENFPENLIIFSEIAAEIQDSAIVEIRENDGQKYGFYSLSKIPREHKIGFSNFDFSQNFANNFTINLPENSENFLQNFEIEKWLFVEKYFFEPGWNLFSLPGIFFSE